MIVDSDASTRSTIRKTIAAPGDTVLECASGPEALAALKAHKPDCVIMAVGPSNFFTLVVIRQIQNHCPSAKLIFMSNAHHPWDLHTVRAFGAKAALVENDFSELSLIVATTRLISSLGVLRH